MEVLRKIMKNSHFAQTLGDKIASSVFVFGGIFTLWYEINIMLTYTSEHNESIISIRNAFHFSVGFCLYFGAMTNWYKMISTRTFAYYAELQPKQQSHWKYCSSCFSFYPTRAHHCKICGVCILKRDHHCWFAGTCIGYMNHRYYLVMLLYIFAAALYSNIYNYSFVITRLGGFTVGTVICLVCPHGAALLGYLSFTQFCLSIVSLSGFVCLIMFTWLLQIQMSQLISGQTKYEKKNLVNQFHVGFKGNLVEVLGERYNISWLCPWISSQLPSDGVQFNEQHKMM